MATSNLSLDPSICPSVSREKLLEQKLQNLADEKLALWDHLRDYVPRWFFNFLDSHMFVNVLSNLHAF